MSRREVVHGNPPCVDPVRCGKPIVSEHDITIVRGDFESIISSRTPSMNEHSLDMSSFASYGSTKDSMNDNLCISQMTRGGVRENDEPKASSLGAVQSAMFRGK